MSQSAIQCDNCGTVVREPLERCPRCRAPLAAPTTPMAAGSWDQIDGGWDDLDTEIASPPQRAQVRPPAPLRAPGPPPAQTPTAQTPTAQTPTAQTHTAQTHTAQTPTTPEATQRVPAMTPTASEEIAPPTDPSLPAAPAQVPTHVEHLVEEDPYLRSPRGPARTLMGMGVFPMAPVLAPDAPDGATQPMPQLDPADDEVTGPVVLPAHEAAPEHLGPMDVPLPFNPHDPGGLPTMPIEAVPPRQRRPAPPSGPLEPAAPRERGASGLPTLPPEGMPDFSQGLPTMDMPQVDDGPSPMDPPQGAPGGGLAPGQTAPRGSTAPPPGAVATQVGDMDELEETRPRAPLPVDQLQSSFAVHDFDDVSMRHFEETPPPQVPGQPGAPTFSEAQTLPPGASPLATEVDEGAQTQRRPSMPDVGEPRTPQRSPSPASGPGPALAPKVTDANSAFSDHTADIPRSHLEPQRGVSVGLIALWTVAIAAVVAAALVLILR